MLTALAYECALCSVSVFRGGFVQSPMQSTCAEKRNFKFVNNTMASGCCGTKKQKLNNSTSIPSCNNGLVPVMTNGSTNGMVALPEMCFFCFDVLYCQLYNLDPPKTPNFSNDA